MAPTIYILSYQLLLGCCLIIFQKALETIIMDSSECQYHFQVRNTIFVYQYTFISFIVFGIFIPLMKQ